MNNCPEREHLQDLVDGYLTREEAERVSTHAATCPACTAEIKEMETLLNRLESLPASTEPGRDLWPAIRAGIENTPDEQTEKTVIPMPEPRRLFSPSSTWIGWGGLAAAAVLALVFGLRAPETEPPVPGEGPAQARVRTSPSSASMVALMALETETQSAGREVMAAYTARQVRLHPTTEDDLSRSLRLMDKAIAETRAALQEDPGNPGLTARLTDRYEQKLKLLRRMMRLSHTA